MQRRIFTILYFICLILRSAFLRPIADLKGILNPEVYHAYFYQSLFGDISFEIMSLIALWYLLGNEYSDKKKTAIVVVIGIIFMGAMTIAGGYSKSIF